MVLLYSNVYLFLFAGCSKTGNQQSCWSPELSTQSYRYTKVLYWCPDLKQDQKISALSFDAIRHQKTRCNSTSTTVALHEPRDPIRPPRLASPNAPCTKPKLEVGPKYGSYDTTLTEPVVTLGKKQHRPFWNHS